MKRRFLFLLMAVCTFIGANAAINRENNKLYASAVTGKQGATVEVTLNMKNSFDIINWQTTLVLPEGVTLKEAAAADRWTQAIQVEGNKLFSETETAVAKGDGVVAKITLEIAADVAEGEYTIQLYPMEMTAADGISVQQVAAQTFTLTVEAGEQQGEKGDLNGDGFIDASDIQVVLNDMLNETNDPAHDLNKDGFIDASDIQVILNIMAEQ